MILTTDDIIKTFRENSQLQLIEKKLREDKVPILSRRELSLFIRLIVVYKIIHTELTLRQTDKNRGKNTLSTELLSNGLSLSMRNLTERMDLSLPNLSYPTEIDLSQLEITLIQLSNKREQTVLKHQIDIDTDFLSVFLNEMVRQYRIVIKLRV